jgi:hypothetical protein
MKPTPARRKITAAGAAYCCRWADKSTLRKQLTDRSALITSDDFVNALAAGDREQDEHSDLSPSVKIDAGY